MLNTVTEIKDKRHYQHPEEVVIYLDPGIQTPEDLVATDVTPPPSFLSEDD